MTDEQPARHLRVRAIREVEIVQTQYVWNNYLPVGEVSLLVGKPGIGKSTVVVDLAAKLTTGQLDGGFKGEPHHVLYSSTEDSPSTLKARFVAAGGDPDYLHLVDVVYGESVDGTPLIVNLDLDAAREAIAVWQPVLLVLDALNSSLSGQLNDNSVVRPQLEKLKLLAHHTGAAILGVGHFRKATAGVDPVDAIGGAGAYTQVVRHVLACGADETTSSSRSSNPTWCRSQLSRRLPTAPRRFRSPQTTEARPPSAGFTGWESRRHPSPISSNIPHTTTLATVRMPPHGSPSTSSIAEARPQLPTCCPTETRPVSPKTR